MLIDDLERNAAPRHIPPKSLVKIQLAPLDPLLSDRQNVLDSLGQPIHNLAHSRDLFLGQVVEALFLQHFLPELLHVVVVLLLEFQSVTSSFHGARPEGKLHDL